MTDAQLGAYQWALDWMSAIDSYSGLIVSMHRTGLWRGRYGVMKHPVGYSLNVPAVRNPAVDEFVERNEAAQRAQRAAVDDNDVTPRGNARFSSSPTRSTCAPAGCNSSPAGSRNAGSRTRRSSGGPCSPALDMIRCRP